jgi:hypothetical protein
MKKDEKFTLKPEDVDITLRDWFAGQALTGLLNYVSPDDWQNGKFKPHAASIYAELSRHLLIADAMLREKGGSA